MVAYFTFSIATVVAMAGSQRTMMLPNSWPSTSAIKRMVSCYGRKSPGFIAFNDGKTLAATNVPLTMKFCRGRRESNWNRIRLSAKFNDSKATKLQTGNFRTREGFWGQEKPATSFRELSMLDALGHRYAVISHH
ncbi:unnamed protein product [Cercospora beticola]|nr:unnamed protein product [Cercospora beticola]